MAKNYIMKKGVSTLNDLKGGAAAFGMGVGNIYYVVKRTEAFYEQIVAEYSVDYADGSNSICPDVGTTTSSAATALLNTGIQDALDKTVECRNDYVVVWPSNSDYDIGAALTLSKKCVHLVCPAGLGNDIGSTNACRIHQLTAATPVFTVSDSAVEIAGFYVKPYAKVTLLELAQNAYAPNIHHNSLIATGYSSTDGEPVIDTIVTGNTLNDGGSWGALERNWIIVNGNCTIASVIYIHANSTACRVNHNEITLGNQAIGTVGIYNDTTLGSTNFNIFNGGGGTFGGTWTHCVYVNVAGSATGNRGMAADGEIVAGGTANRSFSDNMNSASGGAVDDAT